MAARKKLARNITEARILEAAVQLFAQHGFKGTSTRDIAQLARVNEATLFRHFGRKTDLFWAAADSRLNSLKLNRELQHELSSLLASGGVPDSWLRGRTIPRATLQDVRLRPGAKTQVVGEQLAHALLRVGDGLEHR